MLLSVQVKDNLYRLLISNKQVPLTGKELLTLLEHVNSPTVLSGVRVTRSLVLCPSWLYGVCLFLWYLQTLLVSGRWSNFTTLSIASLFVIIYIHVYVLHSYSKTTQQNMVSGVQIEWF